MDAAITCVRRFNRSYTQLVGALDARFLGSETNLAEARLLFEIAAAGAVPARTLHTTLAMDPGYVSRIIARFEARSWIVRVRLTQDARIRSISLTPAGHAILAAINERQRDAIEAMLAPLTVPARADLVAALATVRAYLDPASDMAVTIRTFRTGDLGMIAARQSILYAESHGWGRALEIVEGDATTDFLRAFKPSREQCWIAELDGAMAGSIFITDAGDGTARLRLLYVETFARARGIGDALVAACIQFARDVGYSAMTLWTHTVLHAARRLYAKHGFVLIDTSVHHAFGEPVQGETWRLDLTGGQASA